MNRGAPAPDREQEQRLPQARQLPTAATDVAAELMRHLNTKIVFLYLPMALFGRKWLI